jgi:hypothetical protein
VSRWRRVVAILLVVVAALLAPLTVTALWVRDRILRTDGYVETVTPLASDETVTDALAQRIVNELFAATDLEDRVTGALPGPVDVLGPALTGSLRNLALAQTERFLESDTFESLWIRANRAAHEQVVAMFTGRGDAVTKQDDAIVLDLGAVADAVRERLVDRGVGVLNRVEVPKGAIEVTIFESSLVPQLQTLFDVLDTLATVLPIVFVAVVVGAVAVAPRRRRIIVALGLSVAASTALLSVGIDLGRRITLDEATQASLNADATKAVYDTLVVALRDWSWYVIAGGLLVAVVALASSPGWIGRAAERVRGSSPDVPPAAIWVRAHRTTVAAGLVGLGLLVLVLWPTPTFLVFAIVVLVTAVALATVLALARMQPRSPDPSAAPEAAAPAERVDELG